MKTLITFLISCFLLTSIAEASDIKSADQKTEKVDTIFSAKVRPGSPGAAVAITLDGEVIYMKGYGLANLEYGIPVTPDTIFDLASVSKQFTGMAIAMLEEKKQISLKDDVRKYIPEIPDFGETITLNHLVHHTSGIRDWGFTLYLAGWSFEDLFSFEQILRMVKYQENLNFNPGDEYSYSNTGYNLLAETVKRVTGRSFREWTQENIFKPLNMTNTHFHDNYNEIIKNRAYSYTFDNEKGYQKVIGNMNAIGSASLFSTVKDLSKWILNLENGKVGGKSIINRMLTKGVLNNGTEIDYAFGLNVTSYKGKTKISHRGGWAGYRTIVHYYPEEKLGIVILSNFALIDVERTAKDIADIYLDIPLKAKEERKEVKVNPDIFDKYVGRYQVTPDIFTDVTRDGDKLMIQATNGLKYQIFPESETKYILKVADAQITFIKDKNGKVNQYLDTRGGRTYIIKRVSSESWKPKSLQEYTGTYYCHELDALYRIIIKEGQLYLTHYRIGECKLKPLTPEYFSGDFKFLKSVTFLRNEKKKLTGFRVDALTDRNLIFKKINNNKYFK